MAFGISAGAAALIGGGLSAIGGIGGAMIGANAANSAADKQAAATQQANQLQQQMFEEQRQDQAPWRQAGAQALSQLQDPSFNQTFSGVNLQNDPGYQFRMQEGQRALQRSAAARGGLNSGAFAKALTQYGQDYASNEYNNAYNRFTNDQTNRFNRLSSIAGLGQNANAQLGTLGANYAGQVGNNLTGLAGVQGAAGVASAGAWNGALSGIGKSFNDTIASGQQYQQQQRTNSWMDQILASYGKK